MALFETVSYMIIELLDVAQTHQKLITKKFKSLLADENFIHSTTYNVDSHISIKKRFEIIESMIEEIQHA